jgi:hypothetical protein
VAFDPTNPEAAALRLRRIRRIALITGSLLSVLFVLGLRRCL